jgi:hypothetical protein
VVDLPQGAVIRCTLKKQPERKECAALLRTLFNRLADNRPTGRRRGKLRLHPGDERRVTLGGPRFGRLRNIIGKLVESGTMTAQVDGAGS